MGLACRWFSVASLIAATFALPVHAHLIQTGVPWVAVGGCTNFFAASPT
jgi:hypothetical protein